MARLWGFVDGEPYMLNPHLGVLTLNPRKEKSMAKRHWGASHMAWVRSFQRKRNPRRHYMRNRRRRYYRRNPYPMAGVTTAIGNPRRRRYYRRNPYMRNRRHYRRNPNFGQVFSRSYAGLPTVKSVVWGLVGYSGTAILKGFVDSWMPTSINTQSGFGKYISLLVSLAGMHAIARVVIKQGASIATIGGGIYVASQAIHDFMPGVVPGLNAYTPLMHAYTPLRRYVHGGGMPQLAAHARFGMPQLASQAIGASNIPVAWAGDGAMDILAQRFRRFN